MGETIQINECKVLEKEGVIHLEKGNSARPLYRLFENYVGNWISLKVEGYNNRSGQNVSKRVKLKIVASREGVKGVTKARKRKHHEWRWVSVSIDDIFREYVGEIYRPQVSIRINPNVREIGVEGR